MPKTSMRCIGPGESTRKDIPTRVVFYWVLAGLRTWTEQHDLEHVLVRHAENLEEVHRPWREHNEKMAPRGLFFNFEGFQLLRNACYNIIMNLDTNIKHLNRVGETTAKRLKRLGIETISDLISFFPFRYENFSKSKKIKDLLSGESANVVGHIELINTKKSFRKKISITEAILRDEEDSIRVIWFNQAFISKNIKPGDKVSITGKVENDNGSLVIKSPVYDKAENGDNINTQGIVPVYHSTSNISQKQIRFLIKSALKFLDFLEDPLPKEVNERLKLDQINKAIEKIHFPKSENDISTAQKKLAFNELFLLQIKYISIRKTLQNKKSPKINFLEKETKNFVNSLPFKLTDSQRKSAWEILGDIQKNSPMSRLLEGDVGSGKTVVASIAILNTILGAKQSAIMAPTEILAEQHYKTLLELFKNEKVNIALLSRNFFIINGEKHTKKKILKEIAENKIDLIIGTHSLFQDSVSFKNLALVVIDEQHRFGVEQRKALLDKCGLPDKQSPHFLSMTATPIPRSLALSIYGDLDISIINELPKGRLPIITKLVPPTKENSLHSFVREQINQGRQSFVVCPLIDPSDKLGLKSVKEVYERFSQNIFPDLKIEMLHGKMKNDEKEHIMENFSSNKTNILISTSVIEVGIDIPNANIIIIEGADRFGLSQLHQFRGRVGRGEHQSYCFLATESKAENTLKRLEAMLKTNNGFELSKIDLKLRGPGEFFGSSQKGFPELKVATLFDYEQILLARKSAEEVMKDDPGLTKNPNLKKSLDSFEDDIHLE
ncbi:DNA helicase RecG [Candidatus Parcubacteria bacterium]|nr:MAG: DNA helicase RecG [Candidatus Parcubacteria bacterium]